EADAVPGLMGEYLAALAELAAGDVHPMVQGAMAHLNLVMIHPFSDGNGRMSRIVQSYMLYREQVAEAQFVSIEEYLGRNTSAYYDILARTAPATTDRDRCGVGCGAQIAWRNGSTTSSAAG